ncbi:MAG: HAD family hydrolase [Campylobacterota bacterium]|nr:HAD family hydrolase [Campylobacterota bacterium]
MIILFDLDGTLIDSTEAILEGFGVAFKHFDTPVPTDDAIKKEIGHPLDVMFSTLGVEEKRVWDYVNTYKAHYRKISCQKTLILPDAKEAIKLASQHATLGVVTTKTASFSIELLEHMELMQYFDVLIGREDVKNPKPHPEPILKALEKLPSEESTIWMVGDTCMDILAAKSANISAAAVSCGYGSIESLTSCSTNVFPSSLQAVQYIVKHN